MTGPIDEKRAAQRRKTLGAIIGLAAIAIVVAWLGIAQTQRTRRLASTAVAAPFSTRKHSAAVVDYAWFDARIRELMQQPDMVGLAVGTIEDGEVRFARGYGETLANSGNPVTPDTVFRWASLSKGVASALVVGLAHDGKVSLDAPIATLGTTLTLPGGTRGVTVANVLSHRLGLQRNAWDQRLEAGEDPRVLRAALGTLPAACPPASCYAYQNIAYDTATEIVEHVTGAPYAKVARARLFTPLGMANASIGRDGLESATSWAQPHHPDKRPVKVAEAYYRIPAAGGVNSSIRDLLRWMNAQMGGAPGVLSAAELDTLHRPRVPTPPHGRRGPMDQALKNASYGLGWRSYSYEGHTLVGHRGSVDGYGSLILFDPKLQSGIVMLWNSSHSRAASLQLEFFDRLYGLPPRDWLDLKPPPIAAARAPDQPEQAVAGGGIP